MVKSLFSFSGRAKRSEWWAVSIAVSLLTLALAPMQDDNILVNIIIIALAILSIWISVATNTRRCHDLGHNGFWQLIPFYGIWMGFVKGTEGENEYGPDLHDEIQQKTFCYVKIYINTFM